MVKLIIIGNGFDLAHGIKTSYLDFIESLYNEDLRGKKEFFKLTNTGNIDYDFSSFPSFEVFRKKFSQQRSTVVLGISVSNNLLRSILYDISLKNWVDIEQLYFDKLKEAKDGNIDKLNIDFEEIKIKLIEYLKKQMDCFNKASNHDNVNEINSKNERLINKYIKSFLHGGFKETLFLNFNYTESLTNYISDLTDDDSLKFDVIDLHGNITDDISNVVFGYSDNQSEDYLQLLNKGDNRYLKNIKSTYYNDDFKKLEVFLNTQEDIETHVYGHSCGASDKSILYQIFKNDNVDKIQLHYYKDEYNYREQKMNLMRVFGNNESLNSKLVSFKKSMAMVQLEDV